MKQFRIISICFILCAMFPLFSIITQAHPGRTDSKGGHRDRNTGEYHYHHGFEEHAHYDIDGDGKLDCPYNFVDITAQYSKESTSDNINSSLSNSSRFSFDFESDIILYMLLIGILAYFLYYNFSNKSNKQNPPSIASAKITPNKNLRDTSPSPPVPSDKGKDSITQEPPTKSQEYTYSSRSNTPAWNICRTVWTCTKITMNHAKTNKDFNLYGEAWAIFFYIALKELRKQAIVNEIFSHFQETGIDALQNYSDIEAALSICLSSYKAAAVRLNKCGINPQTEEGIDCLWNDLSRKIYGSSMIPESAKNSFHFSVFMLRREIAKYPNIKSSQHD